MTDCSRKGPLENELRLQTACVDKLEREIRNVDTFVHVYLSIPTHKYFLKCVDKFLSSDNFCSSFPLTVDIVVGIVDDGGGGGATAAIAVAVIMILSLCVHFHHLHITVSLSCLFESACVPFDHKSKFVRPYWFAPSYFSHFISFSLSLPVNVYTYMLYIHIYIYIHTQFIICFVVDEKNNRLFVFDAAT